MEELKPRKFQMWDEFEKWKFVLKESTIKREAWHGKMEADVSKRKDVHIGSERKTPGQCRVV